MEDLLRNLYGMQPGYVISGKQFFKSSAPVVIFHVCACSYLSRKYSVLFSLVDCLKVKCVVVFLKIHKECKTNVMWSSIVIVFPSKEFLNNK